MVGLLGCPPRSPAVEKGYHYPSKPVELSGDNKHKGNRYPSKPVELSDDNKHDKVGYLGWLRCLLQPTLVPIHLN